MEVCPCCGFDPRVPAALSRVRYNARAWGESPAPWLGGLSSDLESLVAAGYAARNRAGWYIPTDKFPRP
jgi:hypothetical protein